MSRRQPFDPMRLAHRAAGLRRRAAGDAGVSVIELVLFMPLLFFAIFATVQFGLVYLGNSAVSSAARETARIARAGGTDAEARERGNDILATIGRGLVEGGGTIRIERSNAGGIGAQVQVTVQAKGVSVVPGLPSPTLEQVVQGPVEEFRGDL